MSATDPNSALPDCGNGMGAAGHLSALDDVFSAI